MTIQTPSVVTAEVLEGAFRGWLNNDPAHTVDTSQHARFLLEAEGISQPATFCNGSFSILLGASSIAIDVLCETPNGPQIARLTQDTTFSLSDA